MKLKKILIMLLAFFLIAMSFIGCDEWSRSDESSPHGNKDNSHSQNSSSDTKNEETEGDLLEGLIDLRPAKLSDDKAILYVKNGQDKDGDGKYWSVNVEMLSEGTSTLLTLTGTNDYEWSPQGLFGNQTIGINNGHFQNFQNGMNFSTINNTNNMFYNFNDFMNMFHF